PDDKRVARSETRGLLPRHRTLDASSRAKHRSEPPRSRLLYHRAQSSSARRLATRAIPLSPRGYRPHCPPPRTMERIGLSIRHQGTIHPPLDPGSSQSPTPTMQSASPKSRAESSGTRSHSELSELQPAPNMPRS